MNNIKQISILILTTSSLLLTGCGSAMTRLLPKMEKIDLPEELMVPPKELKTITKPTAPPEAPKDVPPK